MTTRSMFVVFDLDGTLAINDHRQHFVERPVGEKDWRSFFAACDKDGLFWQVARVLQVLEATGNTVEIWSGRSAEVIDKTRAWLAEHGLGHIPFKCRDEGDHTPDHVLKKQWLDAASQKPDLVFDDRASVVAMLNETGKGLKDAKGVKAMSEQSYRNWKSKNFAGYQIPNDDDVIEANSEE